MTFDEWFADAPLPEGVVEPHNDTEYRWAKAAWEAALAQQARCVHGETEEHTYLDERTNDYEVCHPAQQAQPCGKRAGELVCNNIIGHKGRCGWTVLREQAQPKT